MNLKSFDNLWSQWCGDYESPAEYYARGGTAESLRQDIMDMWPPENKDEREEIDRLIEFYREEYECLT